MGSVHVADCECGFRADVTVGGSKATFVEQSPFPFYCKDCGLVEANTALNTPVCPNCGNTDIHQYGRPPVSVVHADAHSVLEHFYFMAYGTENLCPACRQMTLVFHHARLLFD